MLRGIAWRSRSDQPRSAAVRRFGFTLLMLAALSVAALITNTYLGELSSRWLNRLGFAARDLLHFHWGRLFTSAFVTNGGWTFWGALVMIVLGVGSAEWLVGTRRTVLTFWGVHLITLVAGSLFVAVPMRLAGLSLGTAMVVARDVGPSAGYFGAFGLVSARLPKPWSWISGIVTWGVLIALLWVAVAEHDTTEVIASVAHVMAFPLGWVSSFTGRKQPSH
jgi:hypothetical protein